MEDKPASRNQRCCLGLLYYSQAMSETGKNGRKPFCIGVAHRPGDEVELEDMSRVPDHTTDFKYMCMGHSVYDGSSGAAPAAGADPKLPYCEGLEMIIAAQLEDPGAAAEAAAGPSGRALPSPPPASLLQSMYTSALDNSAYARFYERFMHVAERNVKRMHTTLGEIYSAAFKPPDVERPGRQDE